MIHVDESIGVQKVWNKFLNYLSSRASMDEYKLNSIKFTAIQWTY